jgi:ribosomal protein S18 acetylase RimI-like enzyme
MEIVDLAAQHAEGCLAVAASLPQWFGYPGALEGIASALASQRGFVALERESVTAFLTTSPLFGETMEITYLAVHADRRRQGLGVRLVRAARDAAGAAGASSLCLLTLGPSAENAFYAETVDFYRAVGFWRTKELRLSDWGGAPALLMTAPLTSIV